MKHGYQEIPKKKNGSENVFFDVKGTKKKEKKECKCEGGESDGRRESMRVRVYEKCSRRERVAGGEETHETA